MMIDFAADKKIAMDTMNKTQQPDESIAFHGFQISWVANQNSRQLRSELIQFWLDNGAIADPYEAWRRSFEVAGIARSSTGEIVAVSSLYVDRLMLDGLPYWFYRTFVRPDCRVIGLAPRLFEMACKNLARQHHAEPYAPAGVIVVLENIKLEGSAGERIIRRSGLEKLNLNFQGMSVWRRKF